MRGGKSRWYTRRKLMAGYGIHLAIANKYLEIHPNENKDEFIQGTIDVDLAKDRIKSHYTGTTDYSDLMHFLDQKVVLSGYVKERKLKTSYERGYFLHLVTDYYFYTEFLDKNWIQSVDYTEFKRVMYHDYSALNNFFIQRYGVQYPPAVIEKIESNEDRPEIIQEDAIDKFIEKMSKIDLNQIYLENRGIDVTNM